MTFLEELALRSCERLTSREGCLGPSGYPVEEQCDPCRARAELGRPNEAPRFCEECRTPLRTVERVDDRWVGTDVLGGTTCPPKPHRPHLFYDEFARKSS